jgi:hypothetical protein
MARSRRRKRGRGSGEGQYVNLPYSMLLSPAWLALSGSAVRLWLLLRTRYNGGNNGRLTLSLEEAATQLHIGKATVFAAFAELEEKGFVACMKRGHWYGRRASEWAVTDKGVDGDMPSYAWKRWQPDLSVLESTEKQNAVL